MQSNTETRKKHSTVKGIMTFAQRKRGHMALSAALSVFSALCSFLPYLMIARLAGLFLSGELQYKTVFLLITISAAAYIAQGLMQSASTLLSHRSAFEILENIRKSVTDKMNRLSMGTIRKYSSG